MIHPDAGLSRWPMMLLATLLVLALLFAGVFAAQIDDRERAANAAESQLSIANAEIRSLRSAVELAQEESTLIDGRWVTDLSVTECSGWEPDEPLCASGPELGLFSKDSVAYRKQAFDAVRTGPLTYIATFDESGYHCRGSAGTAEASVTYSVTEAVTLAGRTTASVITGDVDLSLQIADCGRATFKGTFVSNRDDA
jgi:hypothetical protein